MTDLVIVSLESWDEVWRRNQHLAAGLLRADPTMRVLFVEPAQDPLYAAITRSSVRAGRGLRQGPPLDGIEPNQLWLYEPTKLLPRRLDRHVDTRLATSVERVVHKLGFSDPLLWINSPAGAHLLARTDWPALYDITDDWLVADRSPAEHVRLVRDETFLLGHCEEVVVCSPSLARTKRAKSVSLIPNAVDVDAYRVGQARPSDLPDGPVAVYVGTIHTDRMDIDLCLATARALAGVGHLVLVGPALLSAADRQGLLNSGVVLLGAKDRASVPGYLQHADVLVVPHVVNAFTDSLDPIKLYEYRAVGRPVVSTPVAGFLESADPRIRTATATGRHFIEAVRRSLPATSHFPEGAQNPDVPTWANRVSMMREVLDRLASR